MIKPYLPPFKRWTLENFPFIEDDFDAITNYQLYCKIVEYMKSVNTYMQGVDSFLTEVQNYFNNLDVQEEINNKLDQMAEDGILEEIMASYLNTKAIFCFDTVNDLKSATNLINGSYAKTLGYYSVNDGGSSTYKIRTITNDDIVDESFIIALNDNTLIAELIYDNEINVSQVGLYGDRTHDDTAKLNNVLSKMTMGDVLKFSPNKEYLISDTINIPYYVSLDGQGCHIIPTGDTLGSNNYIFNYPSNTLPEGNIILNFSTYFKNFQIINSSNNVKNGIYVNGELKVSNIYSWSLDKTVVISSSYIDFIEIKDINSYGKVGSNYVVEAGYLGDSCVISGIHLYQPDVEYNNRKTLRVTGGRNCITIDRIINGDIYIANSNANLKSLHLESGNITISESNVNIDNAYIVKRNGIYPIVVEGNSTTLNLSNIMVVYQTSFHNYANDNCIDINAGLHSKINIQNCFKNLTNSSDINFKAMSGLTLNDSDFNINKVSNSINSSKSATLYYSPIKTSRRLNNDYNITSNTYLTGNVNSELSPGTYYYTCVFMFDPVRLIGSPNGASVISATTDGTKSILFTVGYKANSNLRIYRGTSSGNYDVYADVGLMSSNVVDNGAVINGCKWESRTTGDKDTILSALDYEFKDDLHKNVIVYTTAIPTVGTWVQGDVIINTSPTSGSYEKWICTASGTPGTWKGVGLIP